MRHVLGWRQVKFVSICRSSALLLPLAAVSCNGTTGLPDGSPLPVVQVLLVPGRSEQLATVHYSSPAQPVVPRQAPPVRADSVTLALVLPGGARIPFQPVPGSPGSFQAPVVVAPLATYHLTGAIGDAAVAGTARVPGPMTVRQPSADTLRFSVAEDLVSVPFEWHAEGAESYLARETDGRGRQQLTLATNDTSGRLVVAPFNFAHPDTIRLSFTAYDPGASRFFLNPDGIVTVDGGVIVGFGAILTAERETIIIWSVP